jgi:hypothetical protein
MGAASNPCLESDDRMAATLYGIRNCEQALAVVDNCEMSRLLDFCGLSVAVSGS